MRKRPIIDQKYKYQVHEGVLPCLVTTIAAAAVSGVVQSFHACPTQYYTHHGPGRVYLITCTCPAAVFCGEECRSQGRVGISPCRATAQVHGGRRVVLENSPAGPAGGQGGFVGRRGRHNEVMRSHREVSDLRACTGKFCSAVYHPCDDSLHDFKSSYRATMRNGCY